MEKGGAEMFLSVLMAARAMTLAVVVPKSETGSYPA
jgi:hypothetical protein